MADRYWKELPMHGANDGHDDYDAKSKADPRSFKFETVNERTSLQTYKF